MWSQHIEKYHELPRWDFFDNLHFREFAEKCRTGAATDRDVTTLLQILDSSTNSIIYDIQRVFHDGIENYGGFLEVFCEKFMLEVFIPRPNKDHMHAISTLLVNQFNVYQYYQVGLGTSDKLEKKVINFYIREFIKLPINSTLWNKHLKFRMSIKPEFDKWEEENQYQTEERKRKVPLSWKYCPFCTEDEEK